uniref:Uncharacterized protein n=1 Tax=Arion vulgaris TaxID=1028688 RepID=A0A0B7A5I4_9EUPU
MAQKEKSPSHIETKNRAERPSSASNPIIRFICINFGKKCSSRIGLYSHNKRCDSAQSRRDIKPIVF